MKKNKVTIVVENGRIETVFADKELEIEVVDFDGVEYNEDMEKLADYVDKLRDDPDLKETVC